MKTKNKPAQSEQKSFGVNYRWSCADGTICTGHTVASGRDRAHAERRFFKQHQHVQLDEEGAAR